jgi:hypothetical protein
MRVQPGHDGVEQVLVVAARPHRRAGALGEREKRPRGVACLGDPVGVQQQPVRPGEAEGARLAPSVAHVEQAKGRGGLIRVDEGRAARAQQQRRRVAAADELGPGIIIEVHHQGGREPLRADQAVQPHRHPG